MRTGTVSKTLYLAEREKIFTGSEHTKFWCSMEEEDGVDPIAEDSQNETNIQNVSFPNN